MHKRRDAEFRFARTVSQSVRSLTSNMAVLKLLAFFGLALFLFFFVDLGCCSTGVVVFTVYLLAGGHKFMWVVVKTLRRDLRGLVMLIKLSVAVKYHRHKKNTLPKIFSSVVKKYSKKACFVYEDKTWTFEDVDNYSNAIANYFYEAGYKPGDVVALFMESRPEFVCFWLGLAKIGVVGALINFNLRSDSLSHSIRTSESKAIILGGELSQAVKDVSPMLPKDIQVYVSGAMLTNDLSSVVLDSVLPKSPRYAPPAVDRDFKDKLFYIFTSGTTGLPKAAVISNIRFFFMAYAIRCAYKIKPDDILYDCLPLYHSSGGILGIGQALIGGTTIVIRRKFSASQFWTDCLTYKCTVAQYIGEICRYLLAQPFRPVENQHQVKLMIGNGMRKQIWEEFQKRFGVTTLGEFYGATEGNCNIVNFGNIIGAVGFTSRIIPSAYPVTLIKVDPATEEPLRDRYGMCIHAEPGEEGELVGKIVKGSPLREFDGYVCKKATEKKVARDVWKKGDAAFRTGDLLIMDEFGYMYFQDRTGDTYRWKGENVSTSEVEAVVSNLIKLKDAVVYGVEVPGIEGRAGMVAIVDENNTLDLKQLNRGLQLKLPPYARPIFVRLTKAVDTTGTFKLKKTDIREEGFNPNIVTDKLYYMDSKTKEFESLTLQVYSDIGSGKIRI